MGVPDDYPLPAELQRGVPPVRRRGRGAGGAVSREALGPARPSFARTRCATNRARDRSTGCRRRRSGTGAGYSRLHAALYELAVADRAALSGESRPASAAGRRGASSKMAYGAEAWARKALTVRSASLPATTNTMCAASSGFFAASSSASRSEACAAPSIWNTAPLYFSPILSAQAASGGVRFGTSDEDDVAMAQQFRRQLRNPYRWGPCSRTDRGSGSASVRRRSGWRRLRGWCRTRSRRWRGGVRYRVVRYAGPSAGSVNSNVTPALSRNDCAVTVFVVFAAK